MKVQDYSHDRWESSGKSIWNGVVIHFACVFDASLVPGCYFSIGFEAVESLLVILLDSTLLSTV